MSLEGRKKKRNILGRKKEKMYLEGGKKKCTRKEERKNVLGRRKEKMYLEEEKTRKCTWKKEINEEMYLGGEKKGYKQLNVSNGKTLWF